MIEPPSATTPFLIHNFLLPLFIYTDKSLIILTHKFKLFKFIRYTLITAFLFLLKIIQTSLHPNHNNSFNSDSHFDELFKCNDAVNGGSGSTGDTCIARALTQLLAIITETPVSSRKYEIVRSYAEKLMDENLAEGYEPLRKVNATVLSRAFSRTLRQLEVAAVVAGDDDDVMSSSGDVVKKGNGYFGLNRVMKTVAWTGFRFRKNRLGLGGSAEKLSAELLWLAEKLTACGSADEAVTQWASASKLASVALSAQLRLQGSLVKLSAYLFKQVASMGDEDAEEGNTEEVRKLKMKMLMSWLPFLCRASIGTDAPILTFNAKIELENVLGELIGSLKHEEEQEKVLSLWLHHFTHCSSSDWPNLHVYYARWCTASRKLLILEGK